MLVLPRMESWYQMRQIRMVIEVRLIYILHKRYLREQLLLKLYHLHWQLQVLKHEMTFDTCNVIISQDMVEMVRLRIYILNSQHQLHRDLMSIVILRKLILILLQQALLQERHQSPNLLLNHISEICYRVHIILHLSIVIVL